MRYRVRLWAFGGGADRYVTVPDEEMKADGGTSVENKVHNLSLIYKYGQNEFQPQNLPSVSVGDQIYYGNYMYVVMGLGFERKATDKDLSLCKTQSDRVRKIMELHRTGSLAPQATT